MRYPHRAAGIDGVAQIVKDLGAKAEPRRLAKLARAYENSAVRRLGYLLEHARHARQAKALEPFALAAKSAKPLDPSIRNLALAGHEPQVKALDAIAQQARTTKLLDPASGIERELSGRWKITVNWPR